MAPAGWETKTEEELRRTADMAHQKVGEELRPLDECREQEVEKYKMDQKMSLALNASQSRSERLITTATTLKRE